MTRRRSVSSRFFCEDELVRLQLLPDRLAVCRLASGDSLPSWATGTFVSITRTSDELSVVCAESAVPDDVKSARGWRALKVEGVLDFSLVGILASLAEPLAAAGVSIFAISTHDTDYILVREQDLRNSIDTLSAAGHELV
jgi:hypothetical protein